MALVEARCRIARVWDKASRIDPSYRITLPHWFAKKGERVLIYAAEIDGEPCLVIRRLGGDK